VRPELFRALSGHPWRLVFPVLALGGLARMRARDARSAFVASGVFLAGRLAATAAGLYPSVLPAREHRPFGLTVDNAASGAHALSSPSIGGSPACCWSRCGSRSPTARSCGASDAAHRSRAR
jgi:cytochrome bd-type quinol oxidase subunit 2